MVIINYEFHYTERGGISDSADMHPVTSAVAADSAFGEQVVACVWFVGIHIFTAFNSSCHSFLGTFNRLGGGRDTTREMR